MSILPSLSSKPFFALWLGTKAPLQFVDLLVAHSEKCSLRVNVLPPFGHWARWADASLLIDWCEGGEQELGALEFDIVTARLVNVDQLVIVINTQANLGTHFYDAEEQKIRLLLEASGFAADDTMIVRMNLNWADNSAQGRVFSELLEIVSDFAVNPFSRETDPFLGEYVSVPLVDALGNRRGVPVEMVLVRSGKVQVGSEIVTCDSRGVRANMVSGLRGPFFQNFVRVLGSGFSAMNWAIESLWREIGNEATVGDKVLLHFRKPSQEGFFIASKHALIDGWSQQKQQLSKVWIRAVGWVDSMDVSIQPDSHFFAADDPSMSVWEARFSGPLCVDGQSVELPDLWSTFRWGVRNKPQLLLMDNFAAAVTVPLSPPV